jgi:hypothetical protein
MVGVWYRTSTNGGAAGRCVNLRRDERRAYKTAAGFGESGDYGEIGITNTGKTIASGAKDSYTGGRGLVQPPDRCVRRRSRRRGRR